MFEDMKAKSFDKISGVVSAARNAWLLSQDRSHPAVSRRQHAPVVPYNNWSYRGRKKKSAQPAAYLGV